MAVNNPPFGKRLQGMRRVSLDQLPPIPEIFDALVATPKDVSSLTLDQLHWFKSVISTIGKEKSFNVQLWHSVSAGCLEEASNYIAQIWANESLTPQAKLELESAWVTIRGFSDQLRSVEHLISGIQDLVDFDTLATTTTPIEAG